MSRAAVLIGVATVPPLPILRAVNSGVAAMCEWARSQGMSENMVRVISDESQEVAVDCISNVIRELVGMGNIEQLIVYFAGHGINIGGHDFWLLSNAKSDSGSAVHVTESEVRARYCGIPHVVFFADSCRTAPSHMEFQCLRGQSIFPNPSPYVNENFVDVLNGASLWDAAREISINDGSGTSFISIYTMVLLEALTGRHVHLFENATPGEHSSLKLRALNQFLCDEVPRRFEEMTDRMPDSFSQKPYGRISSDGAIISHFKKDYRPPREPQYPVQGQFHFDENRLADQHVSPKGDST